MHINQPNNCPKCSEILNRYPGLHKPLLDWFLDFRRRVPEAHVSWAGRGKADQELFFSKGLSRAHYGQSAHNYNAAIDVFRLIQTQASFESPWYRSVVGPEVKQHPELCWYGEPGISFYELPHVEWRAWRALKEAGVLKLVEPV